MKKNLLVFTMLISMFSVVNISQASAEAGGYAVVNPETGAVHGVIVATNADPFGNGGTMPIDYMGCPAGCLIVQQSTSDQNENVAGVAGPNVTHNQDRNIFQVVENNTVEVKSITENISNNSETVTQIIINKSERVYEFEVQDFKNTNVQFQMTEIAPPQNTNVEVIAITKEYACEESESLCSIDKRISSTTLNEESIIFSERKTNEEIQLQIFQEVKIKIQEQINLILSMLGAWKIN